MRLIYAPEDGDRREWTVKLSEMLSVEAEPLEESGGASWSDWEEFADKLNSGNLRARRALLWTLLRRDNPALRLVDLVVKVGEVDMDFDDEQVAALRRDAVDESRSEEEREQARALLAATGREVAPEQPPLPEGDPGKDGPDENGTSSP